MTMPPDGLTGAIFAAEGIQDGCTLLNGPMGCKFYHGYMSDRQFPRVGSMDPLSFREKFYFGQPRVPCTFLEEEDYIGGPSGKLREIIRSLGENVDGPIVIINSPGASLIGEDIDHLVREMGLTERCMVVEAPGFSRPASDCFDETIVEVLRWLKPSKVESKGDSVNIIGASMLQRHWQGTIEEIARLIGPMGLTIQAAVGAGSTSEQLRTSSAARVNISICREYCMKTGEWYDDNFGIKTIQIPSGAPIGFDSTEEWIRAIAYALDRDPSPSLKIVASARATAYREIARFNSLSGLPKGSSFSIKADSSIALPLTRWLYNYLGMYPVAIELSEGSDLAYKESLVTFLNEAGMADAWKRPVHETLADFVFADGATTTLMEKSTMCRIGTEISLPKSHRIDLLPRTIFGVTGSLYLIEQILNGFWGAD
ncbi:MAG: nitrogenase component 1 [Methanomassiliicoccales archaeon]|jgi:nitrogenase molybdenum-iron protein alpha/beta subunit